MPRALYASGPLALAEHICPHVQLPDELMEAVVSTAPEDEALRGRLAADGVRERLIQALLSAGQRRFGPGYTGTYMPPEGVNDAAR